MYCTYNTLQYIAYLQLQYTTIYGLLTENNLRYTKGMQKLKKKEYITENRKPGCLLLLLLYLLFLYVFIFIYTYFYSYCYGLQLYLFLRFMHLYLNFTFKNGHESFPVVLFFFSGGSVNVMFCDNQAEV